MKNKLFLFVILITISAMFYQLGYKFVPSNLNPLAAILALYILAITLTTILAFIIDKQYKIKSRKNHFNSKLIYFFVLAMLGFDFGYLLIYRLGGDASKVFNLSIPLQAIALLIAGLIIYKEKLTIKNLLGIILSLAGVFLISL